MGKTAVLYARVSTREQAERGYSMRQQIERLRGWAEAAGYRVLEEVPDGGYSGASLERPGLERVRDLVEGGEVSVAIAQDMDRWTRDPSDMLILEREFKLFGCELQALDSWSDASPQADMLRTIRSAVSKYERDLTSERSRRNKRKKAREGKVVGGHRVSYGFAWGLNADGKVNRYMVDEEAMRVVRRIFREIAGGTGIHTLQTRLDEEGLPTPGGGRGWGRAFIRTLVTDDLYLPHDVDELLVAGVSEEVLRGLDRDSLYGLYRYRGIPVPVPDAGMPREVVMAARERIKDNRSPSRADSRFWELSGGILRCAECGRALQAFSVRGYHYYRCRGQYERIERCPMRKNFRAERIEHKVLHAVLDVVKDRDALIQKATEDFEARRRELTRAGGTDEAHWQGRLDRLEGQRLDFFRQAARGVLSDGQLDALVAEVDAQQEPIERAMAEYRSRADTLKELEQCHARTVLLIKDGKWAEIGITEPEARRQRYLEIGLTVEAHADESLQLSWGLAGDSLAVSNNGTSPWRRSTPTTPPAL